MAALVTLSKFAIPSAVGDVDGNVFGLNGIDRPWCIDKASGYRFWGMDAPPNTTLGAAAGGALTGTYYWYVTWYNANTDEYGDISNLLGPATLAAQQQTVNRPSTAGIDPQVTHWRLWRTVAGEATTFHLVTTQTIATASYADNIADSVISAAEILDADENGDIIRHSSPDGMIAFVSNHKGRVVGFGGRIESQGTVSITSGTTGVTGTGTQFTQEMVGQKISFANETIVYTIASVTNATTLTLSANKAAPTITNGVYKITPALPADVIWQNAGSESFDPRNRASAFANDGDFPTGMGKIGTTLCLFKGFHIYGWEFGIDPNPATSAVIYPIVEGRGLLNNRCLVTVGPTGYLLDHQGIYQFDGAGQAEPIDQAIRRFFQPDTGIAAEEQVNRTYLYKAHGCYDPKMNAVKFFLPTGTETDPQTVFVYELERQRWTVDRFPMPIRASCVAVDIAGEYRAIVTDAQTSPVGPLALSGTRQVEGTAQGTLSGTATASTNNTLTDGAAAFLNTGLKLFGFPVVAFNTTPPQVRIIGSNTGTQLTVQSNWGTNPPVGTIYKVCAVESRWRSPWFQFDPAARGQGQAINLYFEATSANTPFYIRMFKDYSTTAILEWTPSSESTGVEVPSSALNDGYIKIYSGQLGGRVTLVMPQNVERVFSIEILQYDVNAPIIFLGYDFQGRPLGKTYRPE